MPPISYSIGNTRAQNTMSLSIGAPQVHASGELAAVAAAVQIRIGASGLLARGGLFPKRS